MRMRVNSARQPPLRRRWQIERIPSSGRQGTEECAEDTKRNIVFSVWFHSVANKRTNRNPSSAFGPTLLKE